MLSLPVITALLITNVALGVLTRAAPQLNILPSGFADTDRRVSLADPQHELSRRPLTQLFEHGLRSMLGYFVLAPLTHAFWRRFGGRVGANQLNDAFRETLRHRRMRFDTPAVVEDAVPGISALMLQLPGSAAQDHHRFAIAADTKALGLHAYVVGIRVQ